MTQDYKQWSLPGSSEATAYGIAAVPETLADFCNRPFAADLESFCIENGRLAFLLCMTFHDKPTFQRYVQAKALGVVRESRALMRRQAH